MAVEEEERLVALGLGPFRDRILSEIDSGRRPVSDNALVSLGIQIVTDLRERARTQGPGRSAAIEPTDEPTQKACRELVNDGTLVERDGSFTLPQPRE